MEERIRLRLQRAVENRVFPGGVVGVIGKGGMRTIVPVGHFTYETNSPAVMEGTVYDVASITKSVPTASVALKLVEEGRLDLDGKLADSVPEYGGNYRNRVLIRHLLTYGLIPNFPTPGFVLEKAAPSEIRRNLLNADLLYPPGEKMKYTNLCAILLTIAIERITGSTLDVLGEEYFFRPLGMTATTFAPPVPTDIPPTEIDDWRGLVQGVVHDETSFIMSKERPSGCAGLFSNVPDLLTFMQMLLNEGELGGKRYFSPETVRQMHTNQISIPGVSMGLGWELNEPRFMGKYLRPSTFAKTGFTGTICVIDPEREVAFALLSNRTYPKRGDSGPDNEVRRDISDIVLGSV